MPARVFPFALCSLFSSIGSIYLHWDALPANLDSQPGDKTRSSSSIISLTLQDPGEPFNCSKLLDQNEHSHLGSEKTTRQALNTKATPAVEALWDDLVGQAPPHSLLLHVGETDLLLRTSSMLDAAGKQVVVHSFQPQQSRRMEICEAMTHRGSNGDAVTTLLIHPVAVGEREDVILPTLQSQTSLDIFSSRQGWLESDDDRQRSLNGGGLLRGTLPGVNQAPAIQILSIARTASISSGRVLQGAKELLNRHYVRHILVTENKQDLGSRSQGVAILEDAGYRVHQTINGASDSQQQVTVWWTL